MGQGPVGWATSALIGPIQATYRALSRHEAMDYRKVKVAILYQLEISPEYYQQQFQAKKRKK